MKGRNEVSEESGPFELHVLRNRLLSRLGLAGDLLWSL
jgi:hypothetical protein